MNYDFTEKEFSVFADIAEKIKPLAADRALDRKGTGKNVDNLRQLLRLLAKTPYLSLGILPVDQLNGQLTLMGAMEVVAGLSPSAYLAVEASTRLFGRAVNVWSDREQNPRWLKPLLGGEIIGAVALSETSLNIENAPLATEGKRQSESVIVNGRKQYVINAPIADWIAAAGTLDSKHALFMIEKDAPGLTIDPALETIGYEGVPIAGVTLEDCTIPEDQILFPPGKTEMPTVLRMWEDQIILGASLGISKTAFESARDYAKSHKSGGKPVIAYQEVGFKLAEMLTLLQTAQLLAYRTAWSLESAINESSSHETIPAEVSELLHCAKVFCTEAAEQISSEALQVLGGSGYIAGNPVEQAYRCAKYGRIAGTSSEIARVKIGDAALGYRS